MDPNLHLIERGERRGRRLSSLALLSVIAFLGAASFGLFAFLQANAAYGTAKDLEARYICDPAEFELEFPDLSRLSEVSTVDGVLLGKLTERNSQPTSLDEIPDVVKNAVLAAEDAGYYDHEGVDFRGILRAALANAASDSTGLQGGSTITQQVIKKNFLTDDITIERKICEAVVAAELERTYTKDQILEFYINSVFYGENAYGVKAAAQEYWGKELGEVTIAEAAAMVVPIRNPTVYNLRNNPETVIRGRNAVIDQMVDNEFITEAQGTAAKETPLEVADHEELEELAPQVIIAAREELLDDPRYGLGDTYAERKKALFGCPANDVECEGGGGLEVTVTVNYEWQQEANRMLRTWFQENGGPTGAIAMIENDTGALRVMASGLEFGDDIEAGERPYDLVTKGRRQAGSAFKPMALATALEYGSLDGWDITLGTHWDSSSPIDIDCGSPCSSKGNIWTVRNAESGGGGGIRSLDEATYRSTNTVYAQVALAVGPENIVEMSHRLGIESPLNPVPSITLGTQTVSPFEMAAAYSTIANYGEKVEPYLIEKIEDADGNVIYEHQVDREQVLDRALTAAMVGSLEKVVSQGTATRANIGRPQAGKTGTSQDYRDVWFVGFIPQYTTAVWSGYPDAGIPLERFTVYNEPDGQPQYYDRAFGGTLTAPIWRQFMEYITADLPELDFPEAPDNVEDFFRIPVTTVPDVSGLSRDEARVRLFKAGLIINFASVHSGAPVGAYLGQSPSAGSEVPQGSRVTLSFSAGPAPPPPVDCPPGDPDDPDDPDAPRDDCPEDDDPGDDDGDGPGDDDDDRDGDDPGGGDGDDDGDNGDGDNGNRGGNGRKKD